MYERHRGDGLEVLAVAMDGQGAERARPYLEAAGATYPAVVDAEGVTGRLYGFKAVSSGFLIDERGVLAFSKVSGFGINRPEIAELVRRWVAESEVPPFVETDSHYIQAPRGATDRRALELYRQGAAKYQQGDRAGAAALMREAMRLDPDSIIVHRHAWAIESPERFYDGDIDQGWKQEQLRQGR